VALARALGVSIDYLAGGTAADRPALLQHRVLIYDSKAELLASTVPFLLEGINNDDCVLAVTAGRQIRQLRDALGDASARVEFHDSAQWYRSPAGALHSYRSFVKERVAGGARWCRIIGEIPWAGRSPAEVADLMRYEAMINLSLASLPATILCPYDTRSAPGEVLAGAVRTHPEVVQADRVSTSVAYRAPEDLLLSPP
jgi:hypothetical protein